MKAAVRRMIKAFSLGLAVLVVLFGLMQLIPYGRTHTNPPVIKEPTWDTSRTRDLAVRACFNCHSNETTWPWYASVAPFSWVVQFDVEVARSVINFSEWNRKYPLAPYAGNSVMTGGMPTVKYRLAHPEADLTDEETRALAHGLDAMLKDTDKP